MNRPHLPNCTGGSGREASELCLILAAMLTHAGGKAEKKCFGNSCMNSKCLGPLDGMTWSRSIKKKVTDIPKSLKIYLLLAFSLNGLHFQNRELFSNCRQAWLKQRQSQKSQCAFAGLSKCHESGSISSLLISIGSLPKAIDPGER